MKAKIGTALVPLLLLVACVQEMVPAGTTTNTTTNAITKTSGEVEQWRSLEVTVSAYNSIKAQTNDNPTLAAWGDTLKPGMKAIAISRDLLKMGIGHRTMVRIDGLDGQYEVLDKMNKRWTKKIDLYMGVDVTAARKWGKKTLIMHWIPQSKK